MLLVAERKFLFITAKSLEPGCGIQFFDLLVEESESCLCVPDDLDVGNNHFIHFRWIDINVDYFGICTKFIGLPNNPIVKSRADVEEEVTLDHRLVCVGSAVHPKHSEA